MLTEFSAIKLSNCDKWMLLDYDDYARLSNYGWHSDKDGYAVAAKRINKKLKMLKSHRLILNLTNPKEIVDHINGDKLDNRKSNLRICDTASNAWNTKLHADKLHSKFKGVTFVKVKAEKPWLSRIIVRSERIHIGYFNSEIEAAKAYDEAAIKYFGEFAQINKWF